MPIYSILTPRMIEPTRRVLLYVSTSISKVLSCGVNFLVFTRRKLLRDATRTINPMVLRARKDEKEFLRPVSLGAL